MFKKNKWKLIVSSIVILLPILLGVFGKNYLSDEIVTHWGMDGKPDGWASPTVIFFVLPVILLLIHWLCMVLSYVLDKNERQSKKVMEMTFWIVPVISLLVCGILFATALGYTANIFTVVILILALTFIIMGNYLPKTTRNRTMGIKVKWALASDANWYATHRFAGKVYVILGLLCLLALPLPSSAFPFVALAILLVCSCLPILYSYLFYKKQLSRGESTKEDYEKGLGELGMNKKGMIVITVTITLLLCVILSVVMFTGSVKATTEEDRLSVRASYWSDLTLRYSDIAKVEYREEGVDGERVMGYGTARLLLGGFQNKEFGAYTRYTYTGKDPCVVITTAEGKVLVVGLDEPSETKALYDALVEKTAK